MNTATQNLEFDHVHILRLTDTMEAMVKQSIDDPEHIESVINLIKSYADGIHHLKEENLLFPKMIEKGFSRDQGPLAVMLNEHVQGRNYVKGMVEGLTSYKNGDSLALKSVYSNMLGYVELLRGHILKENNILFRMADQILTAEEQQELTKQFAKVEKNPVCGGVFTDCINEIEKLGALYNA
jgi:hemerythrin-like domain-containing protein